MRTSTAYHPRTNGLTERTNQTLETYLRAYCSYQQDDWVDYLPLAEFAFNNLENSSTKITPFYANYGFHPTFEPRLTTDVTTPAAHDLASRLSIIRDELSAELTAAQTAMATYFNRHRSPAPTFSPGDLVWLLRRNIKTTRPSDKLDYRKIGPFKILHRYGTRSYHLALPKTFSRLHPVFDVSLLEPYSDPSWVPGRSSSQAPVVLEDLDGPAIEKILDCRKLGRRYEYFVHWKNQPDSERSWVTLTDIPRSFDELLQQFHRRHPRLPRPHRFDFDRSFAPPSSTTPSTPLPQLPLEPQDPVPSVIPQDPPDSPPIPPPSHSLSHPTSPIPSHTVLDYPVASNTLPVPFLPLRTPTPPQRRSLLSYVPPDSTTLRSGRISHPPTRSDNVPC